MRTPRWVVACCACMLAGGGAFEVLLPGTHRRSPRRGCEWCEHWRGPAAPDARRARAAPVARLRARDKAAAEEEGLGERLQTFVRRFIPALAFFLFVRTWVITPHPVTCA